MIEAQVQASEAPDRLSASVYSIGREAEPIEKAFAPSGDRWILELEGLPEGCYRVRARCAGRTRIFRRPEIGRLFGFAPCLRRLPWREERVGKTEESVRSGTRGGPRAFSNLPFPSCRRRPGPLLGWVHSADGAGSQSGGTGPATEGARTLRASTRATGSGRPFVQRGPRGARKRARDSHLPVEQPQSHRLPAGAVECGTELRQFLRAHAGGDAGGSDTRGKCGPCRRGTALRRPGAGLQRVSVGGAGYLRFRPLRQAVGQHKLHLEFVGPGAFPNQQHRHIPKGTWGTYPVARCSSRRWKRGRTAFSRSMAPSKSMSCRTTGRFIWSSTGGTW